MIRSILWPLITKTDPQLQLIEHQEIAFANLPFLLNLNPYAMRLVMHAVRLANQGDKSRDVNATLICECLRNCALQTYLDWNQARLALDEMGLKRSEDVGTVVAALSKSVCSKSASAILQQTSTRCLRWEPGMSRGAADHSRSSAFQIASCVALNAGLGGNDGSGQLGSD
jgi:hypothetical protein